MEFLGRLFGGLRRSKTPLDTDLRLERVMVAVLGCCEYGLFAGQGAIAMAKRLARRCPDRECLACDPSTGPFYPAANRTKKINNFAMFNQRPSDFLHGVTDGRPYILERDTLVVLSVAGGGSERRFFSEASLVATKFAAPFLLALGCRVPGNEAFEAESNWGRECNLNNLSSCFADVPYSVYFPAYSLPASRKPGPMGWALAVLGRNAHLQLPDEAQYLLVKRDGISDPAQGKTKSPPAKDGGPKAGLKAFASNIRHLEHQAKD